MLSLPISTLMEQPSETPINVIPLLRLLDERLLDMLKKLAPEDWHKQTVAKLWTVKDVAAHLLDGNIRVLSMLRDGYFGQSPEPNLPGGLLGFLNELNADWVKAMKRVSPGILIFLHEITGQLTTDHYASLDPFEKAIFPVAWAGEKESLNWMHLAREYTEKWLHQQQIRDALKDPTLMAKEFFHPAISIFMYGLPFTYRDIDAEKNTCVKVTISGETGGTWQLIRDSREWSLSRNSLIAPHAEVIIDPNIAWKLFSKSIRYGDVKHGIVIQGDAQLGEVALSMISVMA